MTGQSPMSLVRWCPKLGRLILDNTCFSGDVIDVIINACPHLEILGFYYDYNDDVFNLDDLNNNNNSNDSSNCDNSKKISSLTTATSITPHQSSDNNVVGQLRILSTSIKDSYHTPGMPINQLMRLLQKY